MWKLHDEPDATLGTQVLFWNKNKGAGGEKGGKKKHKSEKDEKNQEIERLQAENAELRRKLESRSHFLDAHDAEEQIRSDQIVMSFLHSKVLIVCQFIQCVCLTDRRLGSWRINWLRLSEKNRRPLIN